MSGSSIEKYKEIITYLLSIRRLQQAKEKALEALAAYPDDGQLHSYLANTHYRLDESEQAIEQATFAIRCDPQDAWPYRILAGAYMDLDELDKALQCAKTAVDLQPDQDICHRLMGRVLYLQQNYRGARRYAEKAIELDTDEPNNYDLMGDALMAMRQFDQAMVYFEKGLRIDPLDWRLHVGMGQCLEKTDRKEKSLIHFAQALKNNPANSSLRDLLQDRFAHFLDQYADLPPRKIAEFFGPEFKVLLSGMKRTRDKDTTYDQFVLTGMFINAILIFPSWDAPNVRMILIAGMGIAACMLALFKWFEYFQYRRAYVALDEPARDTSIKTIHTGVDNRLAAVRIVKIVLFLALTFNVILAINVGEQMDTRQHRLEEAKKQVVIPGYVDRSLFQWNETLAINFNSLYKEQQRFCGGLPKKVYGSTDPGALAGYAERMYRKEYCQLLGNGLRQSDLVHRQLKRGVLKLDQLFEFLWNLPRDPKAPPGAEKLTVTMGPYASEQACNMARAKLKNKTSSQPCRPWNDFVKQIKRQFPRL